MYGLECFFGDELYYLRYFFGVCTLLILQEVLSKVCVVFSGHFFV